MRLMEHLINGWKYSKGKIAGSISPKITDEDQKSDTFSGTRGWIKDCYTDYVAETYELCEDEVSIEYDDEFGESWVLTNTCWDETEWVEIEVCDEYWEDDNEDDNWDNDDPIGGSRTPDNDDIKEKQLEEAYQKKMPEALKILKSMGIDLSKYKIQLNNTICQTNARVYPDGTIEICAQAIVNLTIKDIASILWHEIYHVDHLHHEQDKYVTKCEPFKLVLDDYISPFFDIFIDYKFDGFRTKEEFADEFWLTISAVAPLEWYANEIETYRAEMNNGITPSSTYDAERRFDLWYYEQIYNKLKKQ